MDTKSLKIAVIGGGVCGLTLSIGLQRAGLDVELYEAAVSYSPKPIASVFMLDTYL